MRKLQLPPRAACSRVICLSAIVLVAVTACTTDRTPAGPESPGLSAPSLLVNRAHSDARRSLFIKYKSNAPADRISRLAGAQVRFANDLGGTGRWIAMEVSAQAVDQLALAFRALPWVESVEVGTDASRISTAGALPAVGAALSQTVPWGVDDSDAPYVHSVAGNEGDGIKVAVLDTGMQCTHPDLDGRAQSGYDYVYMTSGGGCTELRPHGTAVAGIIAAADDNAGVVGMAPEASIYSVRVCDEDGDCSDAAIASGINWARSNNMDVINLSIANCGGDLPVGIEYALQQAANDGIIIVASAGNGTHNLCPSTAPVSSYGDVADVIIVGAFFWGDTVGTGYQFGSRIDLVGASNVLSDSGASSTAMFGYASAAVPHVSGAAALLLAAGVSPSQVKSKLTSTARDLGASGKDDYYGYGALDALTPAIPGPQVGSVGYCTESVIYGDCLVTPSRNWGVPGFQWKFEITYSNSILSPINTGWISDSTYLVSAPAGEYQIQVDIWVRENPSASPRARVSNKSTTFLQVCQGEENLMAICPETM